MQTMLVEEHVLKLLQVAEVVMVTAMIVAAGAPKLWPYKSTHKDRFRDCPNDQLPYN